MLTIGLTGGIGSGKSTVANFFSQLGITIIDSDQIARDVVLPGTPALQTIVTHFGKQILDDHGALDRQKLRELIFQHPEERRWLEKLLHPQIREKMRAAVQQAQSSYCVLVIPLLIETQPNPLVNRILVIDSPEDLQIKRTQQRDRLDETQIQAIMQSQATREQRLAAADDVIHNKGDLKQLEIQVQKLHQRYLQLAAGKK